MLLLFAMVKPFPVLLFVVTLIAAMAGVRASAVWIVQAGGVPAAICALVLLFGAGAIFSHYCED